MSNNVNGELPAALRPNRTLQRLASAPLLFYKVIGTVSMGVGVALWRLEVAALDAASSVATTVNVSGAELSTTSPGPGPFLAFAGLLIILACLTRESLQKPSSKSDEGTPHGGPSLSS